MCVYLASLMCYVVVGAHEINTIQTFTENLAAYCESKEASHLYIMESVCGKHDPVFRIGNTYMQNLAKKYNVPTTEVYDWDMYIAVIQKEIDYGVRLSFSNIAKVPEESIEMNYPGLQYVVCNAKVSGASFNEFKDLFILKDNKIVKITDYVEKVDEITGKKKIEIDYIELARIAFGECNYQKCYDYYKQGGLKNLKSKEKNGHMIHDTDIFPYIESCVALHDWDGAMYGFTKLMNRKYWVNGIEWKLNPEDIRDWVKSKEPLMNKLLEKTFLYYTRNPESFRNSPLIRHIQKITGLTTEQYISLAANHFMQNKRLYADRVVGIKAAAEYGNPAAQRQIGKLYLTGHNVDMENPAHYNVILPCDTIKAMYWLNMASTNGDLESSKIVASFHMLGRGVDVNYTKAYSVYSAIDSENDYDIHYGLGICYYFGLGTNQDEEKALHYLLTAEDWHPDVPYLIAQIYLNKSDSHAIKYLNKILKRKNVNDGIKRETLRILSDCYISGKCGIAVNKMESDRLAIEAQNYAQLTSKQIKDFFISLTHIDFENESL